MLNIDCDNPILLKELAGLAADVESCGAFFDKTLILKAQNGNLEMTTSRPGPDQRALMMVPEAAYLPYGKIKFGVEGNNIVIADWGPEISGLKKTMMEKMVRIYNLTHKIAFYKENNPRLVFKDDPEFLQKITSGRANTTMAEKTLAVLDADDLDQFAITNFLRTRNFALRGSDKLLIPFIDFTNHHAMAKPFNRKKVAGHGRTMSLIASEVTPGSAQVFARYGLWDNYDTYLMFGFAQEPSAFVRSVPLEISYDDGKVLKINSRPGMSFKAKLPDAISDIKHPFPFVNSFSDKAQEVAFMHIPGVQTPRALKRVLGALLNFQGETKTLEEKRKRIFEVETKILEGNLKFYDDMLVFLNARKDRYKDLPAFKEAVKMAKLQQKHILEYQAYSFEMENNFQGQDGIA